MSGPNLPPTRRKRPQDKPLTQPHELDFIRPSLVLTYAIGLFVGAFVASWIASAIIICVHLGPHAYFVEHVYFKHTWRLSTGERISVRWQLFWGVVWTALMLTWKTVTLVIIQTIEEFSKSK
jgi:hypothetical protein